MQTQMGANVSITDLIKAIENETMQHRSKYSAVYENQSHENLFEEMKAYTIAKIYKSLFGDLVIIIVANILKINIGIVSDGPQGPKIQNIKTDYFENMKTVYVYKNDEHYDAIIPVVPSVTTGGGGQRSSKINNGHSFQVGCIDGLCYGEKCMCSRGNNYMERLGEVVTCDGKILYDDISSEADLEDCFDKRYIRQIGDKQRSLDKDQDECIYSDGEYPDIKICSWNIGGLTVDKLTDDILGKFLSDFHILLLTETWTCNMDNLSLPGYTYFNYPRLKMHPNARRCSGGIGIFVKDDIMNGISVWKNYGDIIVWIVLKSEYFGFKSDVYIGTVYLVPEGSPHENEDLISLMYDQVKYVPANCDYFLCGDWNGRTNTLPDILLNDISGSDGELNDIVPNDIMTKQYRVKSAMDKNNLNIQRHSMDSGPPNKRGKQLLDFCHACGLIILNGRVHEDKGIGKFTRTDTTGNSVVEYLISQPESTDLLTYFDVHTKFPESDHLPLVFSLRHRAKSRSEGPVHQSNDWDSVYRYVWSLEDLPNIKETLCLWFLPKWIQNQYD